jgi:hypothetical protein
MVSVVSQSIDLEDGMLKRAIKRAPSVVGLVMVAVLVLGFAGSASAFAAAKHKPVVKAVSASAGTTAGGVRVTITGKYFKSGGKSVVKKVTFGTRNATGVHVVSATKITATTPAGKGVVDVRVVTKSGGKSAKVKADRYTYRTATQIAVKAGDAQTASAGAAVATAPSVVVTDAKGKPVAGVTVTFAVASGGGSATGSPAKTDASGVAAVGSWTLGAGAGANTLTATSAGLTGSPVTFTATGTVGALLVELSGTPVRYYSLDELKALTPFAGFAGYKGGKGTFGPEAVTGAKVTDIVKDALGTALAATQSVVVADVNTPTASSKTYTYAQLVTDPATCCPMFTPAGDPMTTFTGTLSPVLVYGDPAGTVMPADRGPLRFFVADSVSETVMTGQYSVGNVDTLNVIATP